MKICTVLKGRIENCPPLLRLLSFFYSKGWHTDVLCTGGDGLPPAVLHGVSFDDRVTAVRVREAEGFLSKMRPVVEVPRLVSALRSRVSTDWDIVFAYNPYALLACFLAGVGEEVPLVYYSAELYDEWRFWPQRWCEAIACKSIRGLIVCQEDRGRILREKLRLDVPSLVVPNSCFDYCRATGWPEKDHNDFSSSPRTVFIYQGVNHLRHRCLRELVQAFGDTDSDVLLRLALTGDPRVTTHLRSLTAKAKHPKNFEFIDYVPYPKHFEAARRCDAGIMLYHPDISLNYRYCAPNKLYEYAMLGLPVLSSDQDHLRSEIEENGFGLCVDPRDRNAIMEAMVQMTDAARLQEMSRRARQWYETSGRYEVIASQLEDWCSTVISGSHRHESSVRAQQ